MHTEMTASRGLHGRDMTQHDKKQLTLRIPHEIHKKMRILAALSDMNMTEYFIELVDREFSQQVKKTGQEQFPLPR